jgi:hypothetical protein
MIRHVNQLQTMEKLSTRSSDAPAELWDMRRQRDESRQCSSRPAGAENSRIILKNFKQDHAGPRRAQSLLQSHAS